MADSKRQIDIFISHSLEDRVKQLRKRHPTLSLEEILRLVKESAESKGKQTDNEPKTQ